MKRIAIALFVSVLASSVAASQPALHEGALGGRHGQPRLSQMPDWFKAAFLDMREDTEEAASAGKRVLLYFYQDGCPSEAYRRSFHIHGAIDYVVSGAYRRQPSFQRFLQHRTELLEKSGIRVNLMD